MDIRTRRVKGSRAGALRAAPLYRARCRGYSRPRHASWHTPCTHPRAFRFVQGGTEMASESPPEGAGTAGTDTGFAERGRDAQSAPSPAVRGRAIGRRGWAGASQEPPLAGFLGRLSVGLGASQLPMPRAMTRMIGVAPTRNWTLLMRVLGLRELATGVGVLRNRKSKEWLGARVAGDVMDLGLLGVALAASRRPARTLGAAAAVLGVTMLDL